MFIIQGPFPAMQSTVLLPSPEIGNQRGLAATVSTQRSMNSTLYTYIKSKRQRKIHTWDFVCARDKSREVKAFVDQYAGRLVRTEDHEGTQRVGYITLNPIELTGGGRAAGWPGGEAYSVSLQLEERV